MEELGEDVKNPKDELAQLMKLVKEAEEKGLGEIGKLLLAVEVDTRLLKESVDKEITLIEELTKDAKGTDEREILNEIREELELAQHIQHQINVLTDLRKLSSDVIKEIKKTDDKDWVDKACMNLTNLDSIAAFIVNLIDERELSKLQLVYNILQEIERPELQEKLVEIRAQFENISQEAAKQFAI
jgi:predicted DNA-binding protein